MGLDQNIYDFIFEDLASRLKRPEVIYTLHNRVQKFDAIPSGVPNIDDVLCGGLPEGRIIEIFGPEASGKTTLTLTFIKHAQQLGYMTYFIDAEHALDVDYASRIGVDIKNLLFSQPDYGEQALETARAICDSTIEASNKFGRKIKTLIVIDSVPALVPKQAYEVYEDDKKDGLESSTAMGMTARMLSQSLPPLLSKLAKSGATVVFINQERDNIGVMYGPTTTTPGGRALKFFCSLRLKVNRIGYFEENGEKAGIRTQVVPVKSKMFPIFARKAEFIIGPNGINTLAALIENAVEKGVVVKAGAWVKFDGNSYQGRPGLEDAVKKDAELMKRLELAVAGKPLPAKPVELKPAVQPEKPVAPPIGAKPVGNYEIKGQGDSK